MGRRWKVLLVTSAARQRAAATALWIAAVGVAAATGPVLGGALVDWQGFLGISILVAVLATPASPGPLAAFDAAWILVAATSGVAALIAGGLGGVRARHEQPPSGDLAETARKEVAT